MTEMALGRLDEPGLTRLFHQLLAKLSLIGETGSRATPSIGRHAQHEGDRPRGPSTTATDRFHALWNAATSDEERRAVITKAAKALKEAGHAPAPPEEFLERGTSEWERRIARTPGPLREVAHRFGVSHEHVRSLRLKFPDSVL
jgi:hypothetical protein